LSGLRELGAGRALTIPKVEWSCFRGYQCL
jgi:hypothetical protein